jgi:glycine hydroxymethyltransferase
MSEWTDIIDQVDPHVGELVRGEETRQSETIRLIASENYASRAVMAATGSVFTNKYAEGYAGKRYYLGQEFVDKLELLCIERGKELFGAEHMNVQPYSGSPANLEMYYALAELGDPILGMGLPAGGHLTHGWKVNFSGRFYDGHAYAVDKDTELIDIEEVRRLAHEVKPKILLCGASAYPRTIDFAAFKEVADEVGAYLVADIAHISGLIAGGVHPSPIPYADVVTSTTHKTLRGPRSGMIMCKSEHAKAIDRAVFPACQGGPHMHAVAALAVAFSEALKPDFKEYAAQIVKNARAMAEALQAHGFRLVTGGTDNHILLLDLTSKNIGGKPAATAMEKAGIVANANSIPFDQRGPFDPSGVRIGTAAVTTRGMNEAEMAQIAKWISAAVDAHDDEATLEGIRGQVADFCGSYPTP